MGTAAGGALASIGRMQTRVARPAAPSDARRRPGPAPTNGEPGPPIDTANLSPADVVGLQATAGNQAAVEAVQRAAATPGPLGARTPPRSTVHGGAPVVQRELSISGAELIARRLHSAMEGWGTDEEAIYGALSGRTPTDYQAIKEAYAKVYDHKDLDAELADELNDSEMARVRAGLAATRDTGALTAEEQGAARVERARQIAQQLIDAMRGWGTDETQIYNALEGRSRDEVDEIRRQYYDMTGHSLERDIRDEMSGSELDRALRLINSGDSGSFRNDFTEYLTEGLHAGGEGIWDWEFVDGNFMAHVDVAFKPEEGVAYDLGKWQTQIAGIWNRFSLTTNTGQEYPILFDLKNQSRAERSVRVVANTQPGVYADPDRAYSDKWYPVMPDTVAPHEFGHLVGLADEYERTAEDYKSVTGEAIPQTANASTQTPAEIAADLHKALYDNDKPQRAAAATTVLETAGLIVGGAAQQGTFAQRVMKAYDDEYSGWFTKTLIQAIRDRCAPGTFWTLLWTFSFESNSIMGNMSDHTHPVAERHLAPVLQVVRARYPSVTWGLKLLR
jgi:Annexin